MKSGYLKLTIFTLAVLLTSLLFCTESSFAGSDGTLTPDEFQELAQYCEAPFRRAKLPSAQTIYTTRSSHLV